MNKFFSNNDKKSRLIDLTFDYIKIHSVKCLTILKCDTIILSGDISCEIVNHHECRPYEELKSDQKDDRIWHQVNLLFICTWREQTMWQNCGSLPEFQCWTHLHRLEVVGIKMEIFSGSKTCSQTKINQSFSKQMIQIARRITVILKMSTMVRKKLKVKTVITMRIRT